jgi:two-component system OmpR family response regulator
VKRARLKGPILLVDDDPDFLEMNRSVLASRGYAVVTRSDPRGALADMEALGPALVVTDLMMDALDSGFTLARALKTDPRFSRIPVIIVTAVASQKGFDFHPRTPADLAAMHADAFFDKPVDPAALVAKVEELLG